MNKKRQGEGYIDTCILVVAAMLVVALAVQVLPVFTTKQALDTYATELVREAAVAGRVGTETALRAEQLNEKLHYAPCHMVCLRRNPAQPGSDRHHIHGVSAGTVRGICLVPHPLAVQGHGKK